MIQVQLKLRVKPKQEVILNDWLLVLTRVWSWAIRKIELDGKDGIYYSKKEFRNLLANHGKKLDKPKQLQNSEKRLAQAQRGKRKNLTSRLQERMKNRRKDDNHKLSRRLVQENKVIVFSKDNIKGIAKSYGKSVAEASHYQLRKMLSYKCTASGRTYIEADSKGSTMTCSHCLAKTGPTGKAGLSVRQWECTECGILHDRDHNAAINTLLVGLGTSLERCA